MRKIQLSRDLDHEGCVVWTGCGQQAVYTTRMHSWLADWAITELAALLKSLSLSPSLSLSLSPCSG